MLKNSSGKYYQKQKERLQKKKAPKRLQDLSKKEKNKK